MTSALLRAFRPNPEISGLNWAYVLVGVADGTMLPFIPLYLLERGLSASLIGLVLAASASASLGAGLAWSYLVDRRLKAERLVVFATMAAAAVALLMFPAAGAATLAVAIVVISHVRSPLILLDPIALRKLRVTSRTDYARIRLRMSAGWAASSVASGALYQAVSMRLIPFVYAPLAAVVGLWVWRAIKPEPPAARATQDPSVRAPLHVRRIPVPMLGFLTSCLLLGVALAATQNFLVLQINVLGGGAFLVGAAAAFQALTEIPTMGYTHVLTRFLSHRVLFAIGCGIYLLTFVAWAFVSSALIAALLKLVIGVGFALTFVSAVMIANELTPSHLRATGQALTKSVMFGLAPIIGAFGGGVVYQTLGPRVMFLAATVLVAAAGVIAVIAVPAPQKVGREEPVLATSPATP